MNSPPFAAPINFPRWIEENRHLLKPPVSNFCIQRGGFTVMILGGPNARTDYHINPTEEWFYQYQGDMCLKLAVPVSMIKPTSAQNESKDSAAHYQFQDLWIREGEMFLLPANIPHNPCRFKNTVGIVIERDRPEGQLDKMRWFCEQCREIIFEEAFQCVDLGIQLKPVIEKYNQHRELRTCNFCKHVNPVPKLVDGDRMELQYV